MGLGSGIRKKPIPDPGSRGQKGTVSRIRIRNTGGKCESWKRIRMVRDERTGDWMNDEVIDYESERMTEKEGG
jgi:hypothetical protein